ncbi:hypothetical protein GCK32_021188, partial [Trichostrongylus colubriformis]
MFTRHDARDLFNNVHQNSWGNYLMMVLRVPCRTYWEQLAKSISAVAAAFVLCANIPFVGKACYVMRVQTSQKTCHLLSSTTCHFNLAALLSSSNRAVLRSGLVTPSFVPIANRFLSLIVVINKLLLHVFATITVILCYYIYSVIRTMKFG